LRKGFGAWLWREWSFGSGIKELKSIAVEHKVQKVGATLAAVVLWDREEIG